MSRVFSYWCPDCPTRLNLETDSPEYLVGDMNGVQCPACEAEMTELDYLTAREIVPNLKVLYVHGTDAEREHAKWRAAEKR